MESYDIAALPTPAEMLHHLKGPSFINRGLMIKGLAYSEDLEILIKITAYSSSINKPIIGVLIQGRL